jgi:hypothetical protein
VGGGRSDPKAGSLASNLAAIRKALLRKSLRKGSLKVRVQAPAAGRFTVTLRAKRSVIATGSCATRRAGRVALKIGLTGKGRHVLRAAGRVRVTLTVRFIPKSGHSASRSAGIALR